jgi:hypothetical protein
MEETNGKRITAEFDRNTATIDIKVDCYVGSSKDKEKCLCNVIFDALRLQNIDAEKITIIDK